MVEEPRKESRSDNNNNKTETSNWTYEYAARNDTSGNIFHSVPKNVSRFTVDTIPPSFLRFAYPPMGVYYRNVLKHCGHEAVRIKS